MTELQTFLQMLTRVGVGHGTRPDYNPVGTSVQVEHDDHDETITDWQFDATGAFIGVVVHDDRDHYAQPKSDIGGEG